MTGILVVDDDPDIRGFISLALIASGYDVREARHGQDALSVLAWWQPDAILLDLHMPVMDGIAFRREQQLDARWSQVPVIVMSAGVNLQAARPILQPCDELPKPFELDRLLDTVGACSARGDLR